MDISNYTRLNQTFTAANVSSRNVIAVTTAMTGLIIYNPIGSGKNVIFTDLSFAWVTAPAAVHNLGFATAAPSTTVPATVTLAGSPTAVANGSGNAGNSVTLAYDAATLPVAPVIRRILGGAVFGSAVGVSPYTLMDHVDGAIMLMPGAVGCFAAVTTTMAGMCSATWIEVPVNP